MSTSFPTVSIFKEAAKLPLGAIGSMLASLGFLLLAMLIGSIVVVIGVLVSGGEELMQAFSQQDAQDPEALAAMMAGGALGLFVTMIGAIAIIMFFSAHIFNYWVNYAAFGADDARWSFSDGRLGAAGTNAVKLFLITILVVLVNLVVISVFSVFGIGPGFADVAANVDYADSTLTNLTSSIVTVVASGGIYSLFSANLTQTALRSRAEGLQHPHTLDFAIVIILLYALYLIPTVLAALTGSSGLTLVVSMALTLYVSFAVPAAHGLRYRVCTAQNVHSTFGDGPPQTE